jgi:hypothetical protein
MRASPRSNKLQAKTIASQLADLQTRITADGIAWDEVVSFVDEG